MEYKVEHVCASQAELGEGPVWHPDENVLYFLDITQGCLYRFDPLSAQHSKQYLGVVVGSMGVRAGGGWVMATRQGFAFYDPADLHFVGKNRRFSFRSCGRSGR